MTIPPQTPLAEQVGSLSEAVISLKQSVLVLSTRLRRTRLIAIGTTVGLLIDLILSVIMVYVATTVTEEVHQTCTLYSQFMKAYNPANAPRLNMDLPTYNNQYRQLQVSADSLKCGIPHRV